MLLLKSTSGFANIALLAGLSLGSVSPCLAIAAEPTGPTKPAVTDPLLLAMQQELDRERDILLLPGMQKPYFIEYRLDDYVTYEAVANFGALTQEEHNHQRVVRVTVRIGDYTIDSSSSRGDGTVELAPEDNDPAALRYALWTTTDEAYKTALRAYATKQAQLKRFEKPPTEKDFSTAPPIVSVEPIVKLELDETEWKKRIVDASGAFLTDPELAAFAPDVQFSSSSARAVVVNHFQVNTEGTILRHGYAAYTASFSVNGQAQDGMRLNRDTGPTTASASELESAEAFHKRAVNAVKAFEALRNAPVADAEDFHGPVLFNATSATGVINRLFVPNVEADRPGMGTTARTNGAYQSSYRARVLPDILDVVDDPRMATFKGRTLIGAYQVDDEGVPAKAVELVNRGKLVNYLVGRTPVRDFPTSNGHGRAAPGQGPRAAAAVIYVKAVNPVPASELHNKLVAMAREQGRDVYEVEAVSGDLIPRMLYRVHPDGSRQLVRGAVFDELDNRSMRSDILAAGDDAVVNNTLGQLPETTIAPSLLFGDIGVKRATEEQQKLPYYGPPDATK